jgi:endonuclease/exonuclease/phosphatase family metal-dependent hydrolase
MIIAGDFNAVIESDEMQLLLKEFNTSNAPRWEDTSPEALWSHVDHKVLIDHVLWSGFECVDYFVAGRSLEKAGVLDHLPVVARLT